MVGNDVHWNYHVSDGSGREQHNVLVGKQTIFVVGIAVIVVMVARPLKVSYVQ